MTKISRRKTHARKERRLGFIAGLSIVVGVGMLVVSLLWPSIVRERAVVAGGVAAVPTNPQTTPATVATTTTVPTVLDRLNTTTTNTTAATAPSTTSTTLVPPSTIALPPFSEPAIPPVSVPTNSRTPDSPIVVAVPNGVTDMNPHVSSQLPTDNAAVMSLVLPSPFRTGARGEPLLDQDLMAEAPKVLNKEPLAVQYQIKDEAVWSDGETIGCDDFRLAAIAGSARYLKKLATGVTEPAFRTETVAGYQHVTGFGCVTPNAKQITVTFDTSEPDWKWLFQSLVPAHVVMATAKVTDLGNLDDAAAISLADAWNSQFSVAKELPATAVSGGAFRVAAVSPDGLLLKPNEKYWAQPPAATAGILVKTVPIGSQLDAMRSGSVQVTGLPADASKLDAIKAGSGVSVARSAPVAVTELVFNFQQPKFQDRTLRRALSACVDRPSLMASRVTPVLPEATVADNRMLGPNDLGYRSTSAGQSGGSDLARELLAKIGYTSAGKTDPVSKGGKNLSFTLFYDPAGSLGKSVAEAVASQCAAAGITLVPTPTAGEVVDGGPWDLALLSGSGDLSLANRTARYTRSSASNIGRYFPNNIPPLVAQAASALTDQDLAEALNKLDEALWNDVPTIPLYRAPALAVVAANVNGVAATPGFAGVFGSARAWR
jgi:peptide/nickel transport system substrate-binding protein